MVKEIEQKVAEALQHDVGRGIVRSDSAARKELDVTTGDVVELKGKKTTAAIVWQAHPRDEGYGIVRMDGYLRQNAGVAIGDKIVIKKADVKEAKKIVLAPKQPMQFSQGFDQVLKRRLVGRALTRGDVIYVAIFGTPFPLVVTQTFPTGVVLVGNDSELALKNEPAKEQGRIPSISYEDIGGLKEEIQKVREMVELPLRHPELFQRLGIDPPKGVLIYGPPGTGKTLLAKAVASESEANFYYIGGPELVSKYVGESEERLRKLFKEAEENSPSIIFMDELDAIAPKREEATGEVERRMVSQLLTLMDGLNARGQVIVIGATNRPNSIDQALRRPGRFDREIEIGVPDRNAREEILEIHTRHMPLSKDVDIKRIADITHGYTGADINSLSKEAAMRALRRKLPDLDLEGPIPAEELEKIEVTHADFMDAMREILPSALREVFTEVPNVRWTDIGGLEKAKQLLNEAVELPLNHPEYFEKMGIRPSKGILLIGPPGTGKTLLAKAVATESQANFISIKGPEVLSKWVGESEKVVREIFKKARQAAPCVVFIDEIDAIAPVRGYDEGSKVTERIVNTLLTEMDGIANTKRVVVIAATNRPDILDVALVRPGRFDYVIEVGIPDVKTREEIFKVHTRGMPLAHDVSLKKLAEATEGYTGADIEGICREAGMILIRSGRVNEKVGLQDFFKAIESIKPSASKGDIGRIEKFKKMESVIYR
ncbi:MAG: CDC48 family AAA ATPase [Candidatus Micrarchaeota archaeon]|nr:CDC48 family AAA ATPase [Candidatus Micrarchaeota archaeon]